MQVVIHIVNAFTRDNKGGNPAGVVLDADHLSQEQKQLVAAQTGLSETAFVSTSEVADFKIEFFTPSRQIPHCGHATIAAFSLLQQKGLLNGKTVSSKETIDGLRQISFDGEAVFMEQSSPAFSNLRDEDIEFLYQAVGVLPEQVSGITICNTGNAFVLLETADEGALEALRPRSLPIRMLSDRYGVIGIYAFCRSQSGKDATARMFAPAYGIDEEAATGMAAGPLACYLHQSGLRKTSINIEQGLFMQPASPSEIVVRLNVSADKIISLMAGGTATVMSKHTQTI